MQVRGLGPEAWCSVTHDILFRNAAAAPAGQSDTGWSPAGWSTAGWRHRCRRTCFRSGRSGIDTTVRADLPTQLHVRRTPLHCASTSIAVSGCFAHERAAWRLTMRVRRRCAMAENLHPRSVSSPGRVDGDPAVSVGDAPWRNLHSRSVRPPGRADGDPAVSVGDCPSAMCHGRI